MKYQDLIDKLKERDDTHQQPTMASGSKPRKDVLSPQVRQLMQKYNSPVKRFSQQMPFLEYPFSSEFKGSQGQFNSESKRCDEKKYSSPDEGSNVAIKKHIEKPTILKRHTATPESSIFKSLKCSEMFQQKRDKFDGRVSCYFTGNDMSRTASQHKDIKRPQEDPFKQQSRSWITERVTTSSGFEGLKSNKENEMATPQRKRFSQIGETIPKKEVQPTLSGLVLKSSTFREAAKQSNPTHRNSQQLKDATKKTLSQFQFKRSDSVYLLGTELKPQSQIPRFEARQLSKSDFEIGKCKGDGKFGRVYPCRHKLTGTLYALKEIPKDLLSRHMMQDQMLREIKLHSFFNHNNIVKLYGFFSDSINIYLLMEYMEDGTLYSLLKKKKRLSEEYVAERLREICSAVIYLHGLEVAHRDIKLENIVLSNGVAKLCDFGWAAMTDCRRTTYCGTFDYVPPEILQGKDYNQKVDLWSIGVLAYELIVGKVPFYHISRSQTINNIVNIDIRGINYPADMTEEAKDFIGRLLRKNPNERLASHLLLTHPFLRINSDRGG